MTPDTATSLQMELPSVSPAQTLDGAALGDSLCSPSFDRATYKEEREKRRHEGNACETTLANLKQWQEIHAELLEAMPEASSAIPAWWIWLELGTQTAAHEAD